jgi:hypothetical protein
MKMNNQVKAEINAWSSEQNETIALGVLCFRVVAMVAYLDNEPLHKENDLGIAYAIGFQQEHISDISEAGRNLIVRAYNSLKQYYQNNPLQGE